MIEQEKIYFLPGDVVTLKKHEIIPNSPIMLVVKKITKTIRTETIKGDFFQGILCRWFTTTGQLQEAPFNTKDLLKL
jgi:uncharacterized protein YodC (DUF2158 family)